MAPSSKPKIIICILAGALLLWMLLSIYYQGGPIYQGLKALNLIPVPTHFTELYFQDPNSLPQYAGKGQLISFAFTIHNVQGATATYPYIAYFEPASGTRTVLLNGQVTLANGASTTVTVSHSFTSAAGTGTVVADLPAFDQQIDFHLSNHP